MCRLGEPGHCASAHIVAAASHVVCFAARDGSPHHPPVCYCVLCADDRNLGAFCTTQSHALAQSRRNAASAPRP